MEKSDVPKEYLKKNALIDLIKYETESNILMTEQYKKLIDSKTQINVEYDRVLNGENYIEFNTLPIEKQIKKFIIFTSQEESVNIITDILKEHKLEFHVLKGKQHQLLSAINDFNDCKKTSIMIINSDNISAGICLEMATDLVFYHHKTNKNIESQMVGRAQRINRTFSLNINYLCYENEKNN